MPKRKILKRILIVLSLLALILLLTLWTVANRIASPSSRPLQKHHQSYLNTPEKHGLTITSHQFLSGKAPTLIVKPRSNSSPAKRGKTLRKQLSDRAIALQTYGRAHSLLVLLHGRHGRKEDLLPIAERFCAAGFICAIPDLPAHGDSPLSTVAFGSTQFESSLANKIADSTIQELALGPIPQFLWGMSMGGSFAVHSAASRPKNWSGMIIVSSFDHLEGVISDSLNSWTGPAASPLLTLMKPMIQAQGGAEISKVSPVKLISRVSIPVFIIHGDSDQLISLHRGKQLAQHCRPPAKFMTVPGGTHDNVLITDAPVYATMAQWLLSRSTNPHR